MVKRDVMYVCMHQSGGVDVPLDAVYLQMYISVPHSVPSQVDMQTVNRNTGSLKIVIFKTTNVENL